MVVELTADVAGADIPDKALPTNRRARCSRRRPPAPLRDAAKALVDAKEPVHLGGRRACCRPSDRDELVELAELLDAPVYTSMPGKSAIDERHPLALVPAAAR